MRKYFNYYVSSRAEWRYIIISFICIMVAGYIYWQDILPLKQALFMNQQHETILIQQLSQLNSLEKLFETNMAKMPQTKNLLNEWQKKFIKSTDMRKLFKEIIAISKRDKLQ